MQVHPSGRSLSSWYGSAGLDDRDVSSKSFLVTDMCTGHEALGMQPSMYGGLVSRRPA